MAAITFPGLRGAKHGRKQLRQDGAHAGRVRKAPKSGESLSMMFF
jgi:hypothetical protein